MSWVRLCSTAVWMPENTGSRVPTPTKESFLVFLYSLYMALALKCSGTHTNRIVYLANDTARTTSTFGVGATMLRVAAANSLCDSNPSDGVRSADSRRLAERHSVGRHTSWGEVPPTQGVHRTR